MESGNVAARRVDGEIAPVGGLKALALDLDGTTKAVGEPLSPLLTDRIARLREKGVKVILVTGRGVADLKTLVDPKIFDAVVAENGTIIVMKGRKRVLVPAEWSRTRDELAEALGRGSEEVLISLDRDRLEDVERLVAGRAVVELNKDRIMIAPKGFDKGTGLLEALREMSIRGGVACAGDGENDIPMFRISDRRIALQNSIEALKGQADFVASRPDGEGVAEAIDELMKSDPSPR